jgi:hypothetical protein
MTFLEHMLCTTLCCRDGDKTLNKTDRCQDMGVRAGHEQSQPVIGRVNPESTIQSGRTCACACLCVCVCVCARAHVCVVLGFWGLNSGPHTCQGGAQSFEPLHQPFFCFSYFSDRVSCFCPGGRQTSILLFRPPT